VQNELLKLQIVLEGEFFYDDLIRKIYATDASVYRELPLAVAYPKNKKDIQLLIEFANEHKTSLIPRTAGTSLAGQCVGDGTVVDMSKYFNQIIEVNTQEKWAKVQPGVIRDELNHFLKDKGLFFGPNTSTANRAMIGGMVANNSCGSYSIVYGSTRDHLIELTCLLSDGSEVVFSAVNKQRLEKKKTGVRLENKLYQHIDHLLAQNENVEAIKKEYPKATVTRRNTGYALDSLLLAYENCNGQATFSLNDLIAGSEGTLCIITEIKLSLSPLPPKHQHLVCAHFNSVNESLKAVPKIMKHQPRAVELMDKIVLDCTKASIKYKPYRFFIKDDPAAILIIECGDEDEQISFQKANTLIEDLKQQGLGYAYPIIEGKQKIKQVWGLRSAGLGLLANVPGDAKAVAIIEDTAVDVNDLPEYIEELTKMMEKHQQRLVYYAHAGAGELHLRPILNLKIEEDRQMFRQIGEESKLHTKNYWNT